MDPFDLIVFVALLIFIYGVFSKLAENSIGLNGNEMILSTIIMTVLLSIYIHGIIAVPLSKLYLMAEKTEMK